MKNFLVLTLTALIALASGCVAGDDPYSRVIQSCNTPVPNLGDYEPTREQQTPTYLTPECKQAIESVVPYDEESWATAPTGLKDKVNEAFQALAAYPIGFPPQNQLFGVSPPLAGAVALDFYRVAQHDSNPNQSLFNYVIDSADEVVYQSVPDGGVGAYYAPAFSSRPRRILIFNRIWDPDDIDSDRYRNPFNRAHTLVHEARHGDGIFHVNCDPSKTGGSMGYYCDNDLLGAYGFGLSYLHMLLEGGSATCTQPGCTPLLPQSIIGEIGRQICNDLKSYVNSRFAALDSLLANVTCNYDIDYQWVMSHEGIPAPPVTPIVPVPVSYSIPSHDMKCNATGEGEL